MAWSNSKIMTTFIRDQLALTSTMNVGATDSIKAALFDNSGTPSQTDTAAHNAYAGSGGNWAAGGVSDASGWPAAGRAHAYSGATRLSTTTTNPITYDSDDTVSANSTTTLSATYGCLIYDDSATTPVADQGWCYNYFGGANSVTNGQFTIVWNVSGVWALTL